MGLDKLEAARDLGRVREVATVFVRHGLGEVLQRIGLAGAIHRAGVLLHVSRGARADVPAPQRLRRALEELGPTFVKLGQLLAGRSDLLGVEWTSELARLREHAAPVAWSEIRDQLREDLGADPEQVFAELDPEPLAAASIAQVHRARLPDGTLVVLKCRRPGIVEVVESDLHWIARLAEIAESEMPKARRWRLRAIVRQFANSLRNELDLSVEARMSQRIAANVAAHPEIVVPRVHSRFTTQRLCVQDYVEGPSLDAWIAAGRPGRVDGASIARTGARVVLGMVFVDGLYHADPHGGNVILRPDGRLALLDFGMIGRLTEARRRSFFELLSAAASRDDERVVDILLQWSGAERVDEAALASDVAAFLDRYHGAELREVDLGRLLRDLAALLRENDLALPADMAMLLKLLLTLESLGRELDPRFQMSEEVAAFGRAELGRAASPLSLLRRGLRGVQQAASTLPQDLGAALSRLRRGGWRVEIELASLQQFTHQLERSINRLTIGLVTSALIVGTSIALTVASGPKLLGFPAFALLGFASSLVLGLALLVAIVRSARK